MLRGREVEALQLACSSQACSQDPALHEEEESRSSRSSQQARQRDVQDIPQKTEQELFIADIVLLSSARIIDDFDWQGARTSIRQIRFGMMTNAFTQWVFFAFSTSTF
ncbi:hypothetical protein NDU88_005238 [Pleurodeles waltl]|uniref:Uncharacterized protein n=1 Tax=Pleurodeles waltl TaxID=8319 RepID=A0AAV7TTE9_PLEWA|nr:hypothetical protein NDU88_005238 [Pleurodeles waltl]